MCNAKKYSFQVLSKSGYKDEDLSKIIDNAIEKNEII